MLAGKKVLVVMPAYNAAQTLERTYQDIPFDVVDEVLLVDDASHDETVEVARRLGIRCVLHDRNLGYGGNQKTCYTEALKLGADIVVMVHPDYQYSPKIIPAMAGLVASGEYDVAIGSRILGGKACQGGMPPYKYLFNRVLTLFQNLLLGAKLSEYHTGFRAFSRKVLETLPWGRTPTILSSTTRCWPRPFTSALPSARFPVPPVIFRKLLPSIFPGASNTAWEWWRLRCNFFCKGGVWASFPSSPPRAGGLGNRD